MRITVLGKSPSWQDVDGACSGYLVEEGSTAVLLDCGNGVFGKLRRFRDYTDIDAVVVTHLHADHLLDLVPYAYGLTYAARQQPVPVAGWPGTDTPARPALHLPEGGRDLFRRIVGAWGDEKLVENAFHLTEYDPAETLELGELRVRFQPVPHYTRTHATEFTARDGGPRFTFGADSRPNDELVEFATDTDLLLVEATLPRPERDGDRGHMTPGEAGDHARRARARRVVLTHITDEYDAVWARSEAATAYGGEVEVAAEGAVYEL